MTAKLGIGFLGAGQMATALAQGWLNGGALDVQACRATDPNRTAADRFARATGIEMLSTAAEVAATCDVLVLAVKPQMLPVLFHEIRSSLKHQHLCISIAAGITLRQLAEGLHSETRMVRVMPNTPALLSCAASGYTANQACTEEDAKLVGMLFNIVGVAYEVPEAQLDAITGLSGSGPAYVYLMIEALADGGVKMGLPREIALKLAAQTVYGSAQMVLQTETHPAILRENVTSPGGTTAAGLLALEEAATRAAFTKAVEQATLRAKELQANH